MENTDEIPRYPDIFVDGYHLVDETGYSKNKIFDPSSIPMW